MLPDCIDPEAGGALRELVKQPIPETEDAFECHCLLDELRNVRLHWVSCPACRREYSGAAVVFEQIGLELENRFRALLSQHKDGFLNQRQSLSAACNESPSDYYPALIAWLVEEYDDVYSLLIGGQEVLGLRVPAVYRGEASWSEYEPILSFGREFISSLEPDVQQFVVAATLSRDLLNRIYGKVCGEVAIPLSESVEFLNIEDTRLRFQMAIVNSELRLDILFQTIELAAIGYISSSADYLKDSYPTTFKQTEGASIPREQTVLPNVLEELRQDFDNALDSLKAGQMETLRLIEHNQRPAAAYEADIEAQLGASLYSRLGEMTRRVLQVAEYLYHINGQEPNYFHGPVMQMAIAYEHELTVRIIWPFVSELQASGVKMYDGQGVSREPLIRGGTVPPNCMMLGNLGRYLRKDPVMRSRISVRGFDAEAIANDATSIALLRNRAAHESVCERAAADDLRRRMLCRDGVFSRLHPIVAIAPNAS